MATIVDDIKAQYQGGSLLIRLIFINAAVFLAINIVDLLFFLFRIENPYNSIGYWLSVPASFYELLFKPWTIFTYMFTHEGAMHIFLNMIILYFSGRIFMQFLNERQLLSTYILGGLSGALLYMLAYNTFPIFSDYINVATCQGASASVLAVLVAVATLAPNFTVNLILFGPVKLKYVALIFLVIDIVSIKGGNPGGHIAHIGGAAFGFLFIRQYQKGKDFSKGFEGFLSGFLNYFKTKPKIKTAYKKPKSDADYNLNRKRQQENIDAILDKISKSGYESLTKEEKELLFKASNNK